MTKLHLVFSLIALFFLVGCGQRIYDIEGTVTLDGTPLNDGYVIFFGKDGSGAEGGARIEDGKYFGKAASGSNRIQVRGFMKLDKPIPDPSLDGAMTDHKQVTSDPLHWDNPDLLVDVTGPQVDIHLISDSPRK